MSEDIIIMSALSGFFWFFGLGVLIMIVGAVFGPPSKKSHRYKTLLADMYVVGIIKQLATKDNVDLVKELSEFNKIMKKTKLSEQGIASVIEDELKEKIAGVQEKSVDKS